MGFTSERKGSVCVSVKVLELFTLTNENVQNTSLWYEKDE